MEAFTPHGAYVGTDRLKRSLTDAESARLGKLLREHDFVGASSVALRFAHKLTRKIEAARDLVGRTNLRLMRWGWDPAEVPLGKRLCRLVWSEFTHQKRETDLAKRAEEGFAAERRLEEERIASPTRAPGGKAAEPISPSVEQQIRRLAEEREQDARDERELAEMHADLDELRRRFAKAGDEVNVLYLDYRMKGVTDPATMATESGRKAEDFYNASKRRNLMVRKLFAAKNDVPPDVEEDEEDS